MAKKAKVVPEQKTGKIKKVSLISFAEENYKEYGIAVNEDRAIPCSTDGLKPVERRFLYAAYLSGAGTGQKKSARVVGDTIGKYHPHGDQSTYQAMVTAVNSCEPTLIGIGNFGSFSDTSAAAHRYTNVRISPFAMKTFFDPFYWPTTEFIPNFDGEEIEPVLLPTLFPNLLVNGTSGIGVGMRTQTPSFTSESVLKLLRAVYAGKKLNASLCIKTLKLVTKYRAHYDHAAHADQLKSLMENGTGRIMFEPVLVVDQKDKCIYVTNFATHSMPATIEALVKKQEKVKRLKSTITKVNDLSAMLTRAGSTAAKKFKGATGLLKIDLKRNATAEDFAFVESQVRTTLSKAESFSIEICERVRKKDEVKVTLGHRSVIQLIEDWMTYREGLEVKACTHHMTRFEAEIKRLDLMMFAITKLDVIAKVLKGKHENLAALNKAMAKALSISEEDAAIITDKKVYQLSAMSKTNLMESKKKFQERVKDMKRRIKNPKVAVGEHLAAMKI